VVEGTMPRAFTIAADGAANGNQRLLHHVERQATNPQVDTYTTTEGGVEPTASRSSGQRHQSLKNRVHQWQEKTSASRTSTIGSERVARGPAGERAARRS